MEESQVTADAVQQEEEKKAFEAAFSDDDAQPEPEIKEPEPGVPAEGTEVPEEDPPKPLTVEDLRAMIEEQTERSKQSSAKLSGKIGELQQKIDAARNVTSGISPQARERMQVDFPELAELLFDGTEAAQQEQYTPPPAVDVEAIKTSTKRELARERLEEDHEDWKEVVTSPEFVTWRSSVLDPKDSAALDTPDKGWRAGFVSKKLSEFKEWKQKQTQQATNKQARLDAAITPRGLPRAGLSHNADDEAAAMRAAMSSD